MEAYDKAYFRSMYIFVASPFCFGFCFGNVVEMLNFNGNYRDCSATIAVLSISSLAGAFICCKATVLMATICIGKFWKKDPLWTCGVARFQTFLAFGSILPGFLFAALPLTLPAVLYEDTCAPKHTLATFVIVQLSIAGAIMYLYFILVILIRCLIRSGKSPSSAENTDGQGPIEIEV